MTRMQLMDFLDIAWRLVAILLSVGVAYWFGNKNGYRQGYYAGYREAIGTIRPALKSTNSSVG